MSPSTKSHPSEAPAASRSRSPKPDFGHPTYYINRELAWLAFNERVLEEAEDAKNRLLERVKFLSIFASNLDEFFMVRVSGLLRQMETGVVAPPPDGMTPSEQMAAIRDRLEPVLERSRACWLEDLEPKLRNEGVVILRHEELDARERRDLRSYFESEIFPILTPLAFDPRHPFPHISSLSLNLAVMVKDEAGNERFARLKVPASLPRLLAVPSGSGQAGGLRRAARSRLVWMEDVVAANLDLLFPGLEVMQASPFRVTRDADLDIEEDEAGDLLTAMAEVVEQRYFGSAIRLEVSEHTPTRIRDVLIHNLGLQPYQVFISRAPIGLAGLFELLAIDRPDLKDTPFQPAVHPAFAGDESIFSVVKRCDVVLFHPYDSFQPVVRFLEEAASDPDVVAIKQTLYRVGANSPIVRALMQARQNGKQVSALVELKARFDEERNIVWARALEQAGVHVVYGVVGLKTHAKICLVVRREEEGVRRYVHLGTGNYNPITAKIYTDIGFFTDDPDVGKDVSDLFNALTGYSAKHEYRKLIVAPHGMRDAILSRIEREVACHVESGDGYMAFKMNALVDKRCIEALYEASQAGVQIDLQVRGICCLRPEVPGVSDSIRVISVVGRFLEHARMYYFRNGGDEELLLGSADLMPRNLDGRVETLFPLEAPELLAALRDDVLQRLIADNEKARRLRADGRYERVRRRAGEPALDCQQRLLQPGASWHLDELT
ncbi:MAG: polyphosphate kinase 1 [Acidobacteria bacterium]|nr:polyphosphate kinase 1 [Acidobacteriota bacterium]